MHAPESPQTRLNSSLTSQRSTNSKQSEIAVNWKDLFLGSFEEGFTLHTQILTSLHQVPEFLISIQDGFDSVVKNKFRLVQLSLHFHNHVRLMWILIPC